MPTLLLNYFMNKLGYVVYSPYICLVVYDNNGLTQQVRRVDSTLPYTFLPYKSIKKGGFLVPPFLSKYTIIF